MKKQIGTKHIFVVEGRWVLVGVLRNEDTTYYYLDDAQCVRRWGTTNGLGELAMDGPTPQTVLDAASQCSIRKDKVLFTLATNGW